MVAGHRTVVTRQEERQVEIVWQQRSFGEKNGDEARKEESPQYPDQLEKMLPQADEDQDLKRRTEEAACRLPQAVVYGLTALAKATVERLIKKEETGVP